MISYLFLLANPLASKIHIFNAFSVRRMCSWSGCTDFLKLCRKPMWINYCNDSIVYQVYHNLNVLKKPTCTPICRVPRQCGTRSTSYYPRAMSPENSFPGPIRTDVEVWSPHHRCSGPTIAWCSVTGQTEATRANGTFSAEVRCPG